MPAELFLMLKNFMVSDNKNEVSAALLDWAEGDPNRLTRVLRYIWNNGYYNGLEYNRATLQTAMEQMEECQNEAYSEISTPIP